MKKRTSGRFQKLISSRRQLINAGVVNGETRDFYFQTEAEALQFCKQLLAAGKADLFRGQTRDWPKILPNFFRPNGGSNKRGRLDRFLGWARAVPQMAIYRLSTPALTAIAQHYGIPTRYLDLTTDPEIAFLFAKLTETGTTGNQQSVVYCFLERELQALPSTAVLRIDVANLWRLERQSGLFLEYLRPGMSQEVRKLAVKVHFPGVPVKASETLHLYPEKKSALEAVIDQWMYRHEIESAIGSLPIPRKVTLRRQTYPGAFRWRQVPEFELDWISGHPGWFVPSIENAPLENDSLEITIPETVISDPAIAQEQFAALIGDSIKEARRSGKHLNFKLELSSGKQLRAAGASRVLNRCWDGLRVLPYTDEEVVCSLSLTAAFLVARSEDVVGVDDWPQILWGKVELLDIAPVGGFLETAYVSASDLEGAISTRYIKHLVKWVRRSVDSVPRSVMKYVVDPWILFNFSAFKRIFVQQFVPTAVDGFWKEDLQDSDGTLENMWSVSFNPALVGFVTEGAYRFYSDYALEKSIDKTICISPEMELEDIEEAFISCMPSILSGSEPYQVKFTGYSRDSRELWEIDRVIEQAGFVLMVGGISVLEVFTSLQDETGRLIRRKGQPVRQGEINRGLGAFEIWLIAQRIFPPPEGMDWPNLRTDFLAALGEANERIELLARKCPDWPGVTV